MAKARSSGTTPVVTSEVTKTIGPARTSSSALLDVTSTPPVTSGIMSGSRRNGSAATGRTSRLSFVRHAKSRCAVHRSISQEPARAPTVCRAMALELLAAIEACHPPSGALQDWAVRWDRRPFTSRTAFTSPSRSLRRRF